MAEYNIDVSGVQPFSCLAAGRFIVYQAEIEYLAIFKELCLYELAIVDQPFPQPLELIPVSFQPHGIKSYARFRARFHFTKLHTNLLF
jgi:hypothetical protein